MKWRQGQFVPMTIPTPAEWLDLLKRRGLPWIGASEGGPDDSHANRGQAAVSRATRAEQRGRRKPGVLSSLHSLLSLPQVFCW